MSNDNVMIKRGGGLHKGEEVYALIAYDTADKARPLWEARKLIIIPCHPKQGARWVNGEPNKAELKQVRAALAKLKPEVPNGK
jgi:hypothetical protein